MQRGNRFESGQHYLYGAQTDTGDMSQQNWFGYDVVRPGLNHAITDGTFLPPRYGGVYGYGTVTAAVSHAGVSNSTVAATQYYGGTYGYGAVAAAGASHGVTDGSAALPQHNRYGYDGVAYAGVFRGNRRVLRCVRVVE